MDNGCIFKTTKNNLPRDFEGFLGVLQHNVGFPRSIELAFMVISAQTSLQFRSGMLSRLASLTKQSWWVYSFQLPGVVQRFSGVRTVRTCWSVAHVPGYSGPCRFA